jgi:glucose/arabinose dehydrogenase
MARGRPAMVAFDQTGALLVSDDVGGIIWRVSRKGAAKSAAAAEK